MKLVPPFPGQRAVIKDLDPPVYVLKGGLKDGDIVKLLEFSPGYWNVERESDGLCGRISMVNIERVLG